MTREQKEELRQEDRDCTIAMLKNHVTVMELRDQLRNAEYMERVLELAWAKARVNWLTVEDERTYDPPL